VIHTVGPNHAAGQRDRSLLESCFRRALEVADQLGARSVAFPLISAGVYGWPKADAIAAAVETVATTSTNVEEVRIVAFDQATFEDVRAALARWTPLRILEGVQVLHERGYHRVRVMPGVSPSGMHWRVTITADRDGSQPDDAHSPVETRSLRYTTGSFTDFAGGEVTVATSPEAVADLILAAFPGIAPTRDDPDYVAWFADLMLLVERAGRPPVAFADYFDDTSGWEIGWGSGVRHPHPPAAPPQR
ncbi:MAG: macro domain-containing protein, partial [Micropruina sp.]